MPFLLYQGPAQYNPFGNIWTVVKHANRNVLSQIASLIIDNHSSTTTVDMLTISDDPGEGPTHQFDCCAVDLGRYAKRHVRYESPRQNRT